MFSSGDTVSHLLSQIIERYNNEQNQENKELIRKSIESLFTILEDTSFITNIALESPPEIPPALKVTKKRFTTDKNTRSDAAAFENELSYKYQRSGFTLPELIECMNVVGPKVGIYMTYQSKRNKSLLLLFIKENFNAIEAEMDKYFNKTEEDIVH